MAQSSSNRTTTHAGHRRQSHGHVTSVPAEHPGQHSNRKETEAHFLVAQGSMTIGRSDEGNRYRNAETVMLETVDGNLRKFMLDDEDIIQIFSPQHIMHMRKTSEAVTNDVPRCKCREAVQLAVQALDSSGYDMLQLSKTLWEIAHAALNISQQDTFNAALKHLPRDKPEEDIQLTSQTLQRIMTLAMASESCGKDRQRRPDGELENMVTTLCSDFNLVINRPPMRRKEDRQHVKSHVACERSGKTIGTHEIWLPPSMVSTDDTSELTGLPHPEEVMRARDAISTQDVSESEDEPESDWEEVTGRILFELSIDASDATTLARIINNNQQYSHGSPQPSSTGTLLSEETHQQAQGKPIGD
ncbi:hypothetical protein V8D89_002966 [Ganoderma adspersum]